MSLDFSKEILRKMAVHRLAILGNGAMHDRDTASECEPDVAGSNVIDFQRQQPALAKKRALDGQYFKRKTRRMNVTRRAS
jgi:hypothetical protein